MLREGKDVRIGAATENEKKLGENGRQFERMGSNRGVNDEMRRKR
jgi:hypothetical protein